MTLSEIFNTEELRDRARNLGGLNGFDLVFVELDDTVDPPVARLTAEFLNDNALAEILNDFDIGRDGESDHFKGFFNDSIESGGFSSNGLHSTKGKDLPN